MNHSKLKFNLFILPLFFSALFFLGCFGRVPIQKYYMLDYVPTVYAEENNITVLPFTIRIKDLDIAEAYKRSEIVYRKSAHELRFYNYHQWAVKPEHIVSDMIYKHIRTSKIFSATTKSLVDGIPDYTLTGQILAIEEYDNKEKWYAHLSINFQLNDENKKKQIWQKTYDVRKKVSQHEPVFVVRELSFLLENTIDKVIKELYNTLASSIVTPEKTVPLEEKTTTSKFQSIWEKPKPDIKPNIKAEIKSSISDTSKADVQNKNSLQAQD